MQVASTDAVLVAEVDSASHTTYHDDQMVCRQPAATKSFGDIRNITRMILGLEQSVRGYQESIQLSGAYATRQTS
jgi:hypothetical protein